MIVSTDAAATGSVPREGDRRRWLALFVVLFAAFMDLLDVTIVNVALPPIQRDLDATYSAGQWVVAGYSLAFALVLVTGGRLGDIAGRRKVFMIGVAGFTLASIVAGAAVTPAMLIGARVVQGAFAGIMVPQVMSVMAARFAPGKERTTAFSLYGLLMGLAQVSGPVLGGLLIHDGGLGWRAIFYINVPVGLLALVGAVRWMDESRSEQPIRLDLTGMALISAAALLITYPLVQGRELGWPPWSLAAIVAGLPMIGLFAWYERRRERRDAAALVPTHLFRRRSFTAGLILMLVLFSGISSYYLALTWTLQFGLGWSPLRMALTALAWPAGVSCTAQFTYRHGHGHGRRLVSAGMPISAAGTAGMAWAMVHYDGHLSSWHLVPWMFCTGIGMGLTIPLLSTLVLGDMPMEDAGAASGVVNTVIQLGGAIGVAAGGVVYFGLSHGHATVPGGFTEAATRTFAYTAGIFLLAALLAPLLPHGSGQPEPHGSGPPEAENEVR